MDKSNNFMEEIKALMINQMFYGEKHQKKALAETRQMELRLTEKIMVKTWFSLFNF